MMNKLMSVRDIAKVKYPAVYEIAESLDEDTALMRVSDVIQLVADHVGYSKSLHTLITTDSVLKILNDYIVNHYGK